MITAAYKTCFILRIRESELVLVLPDVDRLVTDTRCPDTKRPKLSISPPLRGLSINGSLDEVREAVLSGYQLKWYKCFITRCNVLVILLHITEWSCIKVRTYSYVLPTIFFSWLYLVIHHCRDVSAHHITPYETYSNIHLENNYFSNTHPYTVIKDSWKVIFLTILAYKKKFKST